MPEARLDGCIQWSHLSSGHTGANRSVDFFRECFYSSLTLTELRSRMQTIVDACGCHASKQSDSRDRGLISSLPIPYCANSLSTWISSTAYHALAAMIVASWSRVVYLASPVCSLAIRKSQVSRL